MILQSIDIDEKIEKEEYIDGCKITKGVIELYNNSMDFTKIEKEDGIVIESVKNCGGNDITTTYKDGIITKKVIHYSNSSEEYDYIDGIVNSHIKYFSNGEIKWSSHKRGDETIISDYYNNIRKIYKGNIVKTIYLKDRALMNIEVKDNKTSDIYYLDGRHKSIYVDEKLGVKKTVIYKDNIQIYNCLHKETENSIIDNIINNGKEIYIEHDLINNTILIRRENSLTTISGYDIKNRGSEMVKKTEYFDDDGNIISFCDTKYVTNGYRYKIKYRDKREC